MLTIDSDELYKLQLNEWESKLHPLIHTRLEFNLAQDMAVFQRKEKTLTEHCLRDQ